MKKIAPMSTEETKEGWESFWSKLPHSGPLHNSHVIEEKTKKLVFDGSG